MKKLLIISPYFPPSNTADMQRIRMSLPYFKQYNWEAEVVVVATAYSETVKDLLLTESIPKEIKIHQVKAFSKKWTAKFGLGSLALRSLWFYRKKVNKLLNENKYDLIYFSTTQFPLCILGAYWKNKFGIPYVIDMQDPWHSNYYQDKPKNQQPKKYWFSYRLHKFLEPIALKKADGIISVSKAYITTLKNRYPQIANIPAQTIPFGAFSQDNEVLKKHLNQLTLSYLAEKNCINLVYVGRGGYDMQPAITLLFKAFSLGLAQNPTVFKKIRFHFIGTSYAAAGLGIKTIYPLAQAQEIAAYVTEQTNRIGFYQTLFQLQSAHGLIIPGSDDPKYTASKIYPYILAEKPLLAIFNANSSAAEIILNCNAGIVANINNNKENLNLIYNFLLNAAKQTQPKVSTNWANFKAYSAERMTENQCSLFNEVLKLTSNHLK